MNELVPVVWVYGCRTHAALCCYQTRFQKRSMICQASLAGLNKFKKSLAGISNWLGGENSESRKNSKFETIYGNFCTAGIFDHDDKSDTTPSLLILLLQMMRKDKCSTVCLFAGNGKVSLLIVPPIG